MCHKQHTFVLIIFFCLHCRLNKVQHEQMNVITFQILCVKRIKHPTIKCTDKNTRIPALVSLFWRNEELLWLTSYCFQKRVKIELGLEMYLANARGLEIWIIKNPNISLSLPLRGIYVKKTFTCHLHVCHLFLISICTIIKIKKRKWRERTFSWVIKFSWGIEWREKFYYIQQF